MDWDNDDAMGDCTLDPAWLKTRSAHFCSRMICKNSYDTSTLVHHYNREIQRIHDEQKELRRENRGLREKLKAARARIKQATSSE